MISSSKKDQWFQRVLNNVNPRIVGEPIGFYNIPEELDEIFDAETILSIGVGDGEFDLKLYDMLPKLKHYIAVEPNGALLESFNANIQSHQTQFELKQARFEDYHHTAQKVDLLIFRHCTYYIHDIKKAMEKALKIAKRVLIYVNDDDSGLSDVGQHFERPTLPKQSYWTGSYEIRQVFDDLNVNYCIFNFKTSYVDVADVDTYLTQFFLLKENPTAYEINTLRNYIIERYPDNRLPIGEDIIYAWL